MRQFQALIINATIKRDNRLHEILVSLYVTSGRLDADDKNVTTEYPMDSDLYRKQHINP